MTVTTPAAELLRRTLRRHAAGVTVLTVPGPAGFTATSFTSASLEPALVSFYLSTTASSAPAVRAAPVFAAHVLGVDQQELAERFARSGVDRFAGVSWSPGPEGVPLLEGVPAWLTARPVLRQEIGDHLLVVGQVTAAGGGAARSPLLHHAGTFGSFHAPPDARTAPRNTAVAAAAAGFPTGFRPPPGLTGPTPA
ncbi:flavin reductase family protein [Streptomyces sp. AK08-02]|uniref:flavin reductase family protein n=1 Tax=Streptomyces sp. AK08-02 TaxID=3028654 RepID=UPI0029A1009A|nr:flavin reductase family protein [Streptomyces sp. AK08-02]MDX3751732.1 flavin reductase family protein [Streptomyces sp. AK08-02]